MHTYHSVLFLFVLAWPSLSLSLSCCMFSTTKMQVNYLMVTVFASFLHTVHTQFIANAERLQRMITYANLK